MVGLYVLIALLLLALNAFFVLAEFASVKVRPSRIEELAAAGSARAVLVRQVQAQLDEYLSVCQVGITLASIAPLLTWSGAHAAALSHTVAISIAYVLVSYLHIVFGELIPKSMAIREAEVAALRVAYPLRMFHFLFYVPLVILNGSANVVLRLAGYPPRPREHGPSEEELKIILAGSHSTGVISFRRLLLLENVFDLGDLKVRDAMRPKAQVKTLRAEMTLEAIARVAIDSRNSRYPVIDGADRVVGILHVKDLLYELLRGRPPDRISALVRRAVTVDGDTPLERALTDLQRQRQHAAIVTEGGKWVGLITMEDVLEEVVGTIEDEFETEPPLFLIDILTPGRIVLQTEASSLHEAIATVISAVQPSELPAAPERIARLVQERQAALSTYMGHGVAIPHARIDGIARSVMIFARSLEGVPVEGRGERAHLLFFLLTPAKAPREQVRLLARVARLLESEYVAERLRTAATAGDILEVIREGDPSN
jgi:CBS domain containing-hemolysin-like protein